MEINLAKPWEDEKTIYFMPLIENVTHGRNGWERMNCPICGGRMLEDYISEKV